MEFAKLPGETTLAGVGEAVVIFDDQCAGGIGFNDDGRPDFFDCVETSLALAIGADNAIRGLIAGKIDFAGIRALDAFIESLPR